MHTCCTRLSRINMARNVSLMYRFHLQTFLLLLAILTVNCQQGVMHSFNKTNEICDRIHNNSSIDLQGAFIHKQLYLTLKSWNVLKVDLNQVSYGQIDLRYVDDKPIEEIWNDFSKIPQFTAMKNEDVRIFQVDGKKKSQSQPLVYFVSMAKPEVQVVLDLNAKNVWTETVVGINQASLNNVLLVITDGKTFMISFSRSNASDGELFMNRWHLTFKQNGSLDKINKNPTVHHLYYESNNASNTRAKLLILNAPREKISPFKNWANLTPVTDWPLHSGFLLHNFWHILNEKTMHFFANYLSDTNPVVLHEDLLIKSASNSFVCDPNQTTSVIPYPTTTDLTAPSEISITAPPTTKLPHHDYTNTTTVKSHSKLNIILGGISGVAIIVFIVVIIFFLYDNNSTATYPLKNQQLFTKQIISENEVPQIKSKSSSKSLKRSNSAGYMPVHSGVSN